MSAKTDLPNPKDLIGIKKPPLWLVPSTGILHTAMAMKNGAEKYGPYNWRDHPVQNVIYVDAAMRHIMAYLDGEDYASDSGVHHLGHASACLHIIIDAMEHGNMIDKRPPAGKAPDLIKRFTVG